MSPSHTVGLEHEFIYPFEERAGEMSPSHTVGLKHLIKNLKIKTSSLSKLKQPTERAH